MDAVFGTGGEVDFRKAYKNWIAMQSSMGRSLLCAFIERGKVWLCCGTKKLYASDAVAAANPIPHYIRVTNLQGRTDTEYSTAIYRMTSNDQLVE